MSSTGNTWKKVMIIASLAGASCLMTIFLINQEIYKITQSANQESEVLDRPESPPPSYQADEESRIQANATIAGTAVRKNIRSDIGENATVIFQVPNGQRVVVTDWRREPNGFLWYKVSVPNSRVEGWIAHHLVDLDSTANVPRETLQRPQTPFFPSPSTSPTQATPYSETNAIIAGYSGVKNIRSGPGTNYGVVTSIPTGTRIRIISSSSDQGGYLWYQVALPNGVTGWIAAQLVNRN
jgi:serine/threonine protein kinase, bacterial